MNSIESHPSFTGEIFIGIFILAALILAMLTWFIQFFYAWRFCMKRSPPLIGRDSETPSLFGQREQRAQSEEHRVKTTICLILSSAPCSLCFTSLPPIPARFAIETSRSHRAPFRGSVRCRCEHPNPLTHKEARYRGLHKPIGLLL